MKQDNCYLKRRKSLLEKLSGDALVIFSAPERNRAADTSYPHIQEASFLYLTGIDEPDCALLLRGGSDKPHSVIFASPKNPNKEIWEGKRLGLKAIKSRTKVDKVLSIHSLDGELPELLRGCRTVHTSLGLSDELDQLAIKLISSPWGPRVDQPTSIADARVLLAEMRVKKDSSERKLIQRAVDISTESFQQILPLAASMKSEIHLARSLEAEFAKHGSPRIAFPTIVASGVNATCLHHSPSSQKIKRDALVLIDAGASFEGYNADLSRTFPASGKFSKPQAALYDIVFRAHQAALKKCKPGSSIKKVHEAAVKSIIEGLLELKLLKGSAKKVLKTGSFRKFYMHGTSHWLGLDVHDVNPIQYKKPFEPTRGYDLPLETGQIFTVEPGIYVPANDPSIPKQFRGIGIRLENNIAITRESHINLSRALGSSRDEIEALMKN